MSTAEPDVAERRLAGHTRVSTQALIGCARAVASEVFSVPAASVRVALNDEYGSLALSLSLPLPLTLRPHAADGAHPDGRPTVWERARDSRAAVRDRFVRLTGASVSRVDVRVTGIAPRPRRSIG